MSMDSIGNFLTIIRNGIMASKPFVIAPHSKMSVELMRILKEEGFIKNFEIDNSDPVIKKIKVVLKYVQGESVIHKIVRVSTPGRRVYAKIKNVLAGCGHYANSNGLRVTFHPGPFNVLTSPNEDVVNRTIKDLETHGEIFDMMGLDKSPYNKINIHCNGVYGDKISAMDRFCNNFNRLSDSVKSRLTVENDDKASMYSVKDLMYIHDKIKIPIVFWVR